jgi:hypothetical protein
MGLPQLGGARGGQMIEGDARFHGSHIVAVRARYRDQPQFRQTLDRAPHVLGWKPGGQTVDCGRPGTQHGHVNLGVPRREPEPAQVIQQVSLAHQRNVTLS